jgi:hypothetical protein
MIENRGSGDIRARQGGGTKVNGKLLVILSQYNNKRSQLIAGVFKYMVPRCFVWVR